MTIKSAKKRLWAAIACVAVFGCEPDDAAFDDGAGEPDGAAQGDGASGPDALRGDVILRNRVALDMPILLRPLADDVELDCAEVERDPTAGLPLSSFAQGDVVTLAPHEMVAVWPHAPQERPCYAVWVESEGLGTRVLFWRDGAPPIQGHQPSCCDTGDGIVQLMVVDNGAALELEATTGLVHATTP